MILRNDLCGQVCKTIYKSLSHKFRIINLKKSLFLYYVFYKDDFIIFNLSTHGHPFFPFSRKCQDDNHVYLNETMYFYIHPYSKQKLTFQ